MKSIELWSVVGIVMAGNIVVFRYRLNLPGGVLFFLAETCCLISIFLGFLGGGRGQAKNEPA